LGLGLRALLAFFLLVQGEVVRLLAQKALGLIGKIFAGLDGLFSGKIERGLACECFERSESVL
jgi:hypothetical protein